MYQEPAPGLYRHYKGGEYRVVGTARHSETDEPMVVYRCLYDNDSLWVRPLAMFLGTVAVDGTELPRFSLVARDRAGGPVASELIAGLGLERHPEGGWYRETYRAAGTIPGTLLPGQVGGERSFSTAIYFLLERGDISALHRIRSDELWHFHAGAPLIVHVITPAGGSYALALGSDPAAGETFQAVVPAGCWFGAETTGDYSLVGCTVAPGFDFADFEMGSRADLLGRFPTHAGIIRRLTRDGD